MIVSFINNELNRDPLPISRTPCVTKHRNGSPLCFDEMFKPFFGLLNELNHGPFPFDKTSLSLAKFTTVHHSRSIQCSKFLTLLVFIATS